MHSLYEEWLTDQVIGFSANWLIVDDPIVRDESLFIAAGQTIANSAHVLEGLSLPTLSLLASIPEGEATIYSDPVTDERFFDISELIERAKALLRQFAGKGTHSSALAANAALIIQRDHLSFESFLRWASRASPRVAQFKGSATEWNREIWSHIRACLAGSGSFDEADAALLRVRDPASRLTNRISALDELYKLVNESAELEADHPAAQSWIRFAKDLMSRQFCWPLMVANVGGTISGISLPISAFLSEDGECKVYFKDGMSRYTEYVGDDSAEISFGFNKGSLRWNWEWGNAFKVGLFTANALWAAQNGRLAAWDKKESRRTCSLVVDLAHANAIVSRLYDQAGSSVAFSLSGRSAEAYLAQVALGLMLPESSKPDGVATGKVRYEQGFYRLLPVEGIREKLRYANNSGMFSRMVLPEDKRTKEEAGEEIKALEQARLVEINSCPSARSAADAMQSSGWRRTYFFRTPAVQRSFYRLLYELFQFDNPQQSTDQQRENADDYLPEEDRNDKKRESKGNPLPDHELRKLQQLSAYLTSENYTVKYCKRSDILSEELLGKWLAWIDHQVRGGYGGEAGGVGCGLRAHIEAGQ